MYYVYYIQTEDKLHWYVGITSNLKRRLSEHNNGLSKHTSKFIEWQSWNLMMYTAFKDKKLALNFEQYLKSHSGRAFAKKHYEKHDPASL